jgi:hypothetical protein
VLRAFSAIVVPLTDEVHAHRAVPSTAIFSKLGITGEATDADSGEPSAEDQAASRRDSMITRAIELYDLDDDDRQLSMGSTRARSPTLPIAWQPVYTDQGSLDPIARKAGAGSVPVLATGRRSYRPQIGLILTDATPVLTTTHHWFTWYG